MATAFQSNAFANNAFQIDVVDVNQAPSGGVPAYPRAPTRKDIRKARERFGIPDEKMLAAESVIAQVAAAQAKLLEYDAQKRFEELHRELLLRGIEWEARYLESLNLQRERLIDAEIAYRMALLQRNNKEAVMLLLMAAAVAVS